jgi:hypothetical protein
VSSFQTYLDGRLILVTKAQYSDPVLVDEFLVFEPNQVERSREYKGLSFKPSRMKVLGFQSYIRILG